MDLTEKYRPASFADVVGQGRAVAQIGSVMERHGWAGHCWWLYGASGTGKTTLARILAAHGADMHSTQEYVGRDMTVDDARRIADTIPMSSMFGGRAWIINEAQDLSDGVLGLLLEIAERVKCSTRDVLIFTAMCMPTLMDARGAKYHALMTRCHMPEMAAPDEPGFQAEVVEHVLAVARREGIPATPDGVRLVCQKRRWSIRAAVAALEFFTEGFAPCSNAPTPTAEVAESVRYCCCCGKGLPDATAWYCPDCKAIRGRKLRQFCWYCGGGLENSAAWACEKCQKT